MLRTLISRLWRLVPPGPLKNRLGCAIYNLRNNGFRIRFEGGHYVVAYPAFEIRFVSNPYHLLAHNGEYTRFYQPRRADVIVDAGAYAGTFGLYCSKLVGPEGRVLCFEPDPATYRELLENIRINQATNVVAIPKGLWSSERTLSFCSSGSVGSSFLANAEGGTVVEVPVTTLDLVAEREGLTRLDLLKMDVEGAEMEAIEGARQCLARFRTHLAIASYHIVNGQQTYRAVEPQLAALQLKPQTVHGLDIVTYANPA